MIKGLKSSGKKLKIRVKNKRGNLKSYNNV